MELEHWMWRFERQKTFEETIAKCAIINKGQPIKYVKHLLEGQCWWWCWSTWSYSPLKKNANYVAADWRSKEVESSVRRGMWAEFLKDSQWPSFLIWEWNLSLWWDIHDDVMLYKRDFVDVIKFPNNWTCIQGYYLEWADSNQWSSWWKRFKVWERFNESNSLMLALKMEGDTWQGIWMAYGSWEWSLDDGQQKIQRPQYHTCKELNPAQIPTSIWEWNQNDMLNLVLWDSQLKTHLCHVHIPDTQNCERINACCFTLLNLCNLLHSNRKLMQGEN